MEKRLFLLDGMALVYRAHFALAAKPIFNSKGMNTSALYGFTQTLLDILNKQKPTHIGVVFDTDKPTQRHKDFADYKSERQSMPEDLSAAMPHVFRMIEGFNIPVITCDGYEADDVIGTLACAAEREGFTTYMVTPDKDFCQLVSERIFIYKPSRMGDAVELLGITEVLQKWGVNQVSQVVDILGLWGDSIDNIPGVPGIGEKTASKLITQYGSIENLLAHTHELKGKLKESLETHREQALLSKKLATILCDAPCLLDIESLQLKPMDSEKVKSLCLEFEFNTIGRRLFGEDFRATRSGKTVEAEAEADEPASDQVQTSTPARELRPFAEGEKDYRICNSIAEQESLVQQLKQAGELAIAVDATHIESRQARIRGVAFSRAKGTGYYFPNVEGLLERLAPVLQDRSKVLIGHDLKYQLGVLRWHGQKVQRKCYDTQLAHCLLEPDVKHTIDYLSETVLGCTLSAPASQTLTGELDLAPAQDENLFRQCIEGADAALQFWEKLAPQLKEKGQEQVYFRIEGPLVPVLVEMEFEGIKIDSNALVEFSQQLSSQMAGWEKEIHQMAGCEFNINSPKKLGEILFDVLKLIEKPKKTKTGQYATDEQTLLSLSKVHPMVGKLLDWRAANKLKSTYAETLPLAIWPKTNRVHTTFGQALTSTGRLQSQNPNLQNIPIRTDLGKEIRRAFVSRDKDHLLLAADYSQIELRIIASICGEPALSEAFRTNADVHTATAAKVYGVAIEAVTPEMRGKAKMVNYGIAYGISAFGLAQRLNIPRKEAAEIIENYFTQFPAIRAYMCDTVDFARKHGYAETLSGRRRYLRDINSSNATIRSAAERNAINAPIQGSAADMIKLAMVGVHAQLEDLGLRTRMLLQVHDELVFDLYIPEQETVTTLVKREMEQALPLSVPVEVDIGIASNWLEC
ncbi:MAG: DNA polymerase I [Verrucomicrobiota bacterium]|nr:DNA polymerase I [Verrucomicrobiota bacterium]